jgi:hypothetical protein
MKPEKLYTVVLDYAGGTYIAQVQASSPATALSKWVSKIRKEDAGEWGIRRKVLAEIIRGQEVVPLDGCVNVWCVCGTVRSDLALINVIATAKSRDTK